MPKNSATRARPKMVGIANATPATPTQKVCSKTDSAIRRRGMPSACRMANSRIDAAVAAYKVCVVTAAPTSRPNSAE